MKLSVSILEADSVHFSLLAEVSHDEAKMKDLP